MPLTKLVQMKNTNFNVEDLIDPKKFQDDLNVDNYSKEFLLDALKGMLIIRLAEEKLAEQRELGVIGGPVHLSAGQEAMAVGISMNLSSSDRVFGAHRSHSHILSMNPNVHKLFAEVLGKDTGFSKGMGGSMHLVDMDSGFYGSVPIVSGTVPLAVGAGFDAKINSSDAISVAYLGDGAVEEGIVQESLNLAQVINSPTFFVVENNLFASHMNISLRQPFKSTCRFAEANGIKNLMIDGNNILEVYEKSKLLIDTSRASGKPGFLEGITFRHYGHVDWRKDIDVGVDRSQEDIDQWMLRDPIKRLVKGMFNAKVISDTDLHDINSELKIMIESSWDLALQDPYPSEDSLLNRVYFNDN